MVQLQQFYIIIQNSWAEHLNYSSCTIYWEAIFERFYWSRVHSLSACVQTMMDLALCNSGKCDHFNNLFQIMLVIQELIPLIYKESVV